MSAHARLLRQLQEIQQTDRRAIPCRGPHGTRWITGTPRDQLYAAEMCQHCPAKSACGGYALAAEEPVGVWGGLTPKQRAQLQGQRKRAEKREEESAA